MVSGVGSEVDVPQPTPPRSEQLARQLLFSAEGGAPSPAALAAVATRVYTRLRAHLAVFLGEQGFDALWQRAIYLGQQASYAGSDAANEASPATLPPGLQRVVRSGDAAHAHAQLVAAFASFIALLFTFLGEELVTRLITQAWPGLSPTAPDDYAQGAMP